MKMPEALFAIINPTMSLLLRSPIHGLWSKSLMLITFKGRKSGKSFTTPVRYIQDNDVIRCFSSSQNQWWRNFRDGAEVVLRVKGKDARYKALTIENQPEEIRNWLVIYLAQFPQDAAYHDVKLNKDKTLVMEDLERATHNAIVVEAHPV